MIADIATIVWKEWKEILGEGSRSKLGILGFIVLFGVFLPLQMGSAWIESPTVLVYWAWAPLFMVTSTIAIAFAGERENHTLETLLASRLSDQAILFGKLVAALGYGVGITWLSLLLGLVTVNLASGRVELLLYSPAVGLGIVGLSLLGASLAACVGILISLRAATVRQAQQTMSIAIMVLLFVPLLGWTKLPEDLRTRLLEMIIAMKFTQLTLFAISILVFLNLWLLIAVAARFKRTRLSLE